MRKTLSLIALFALLLTALSAAVVAQEETVVFWSTETQPARAEKTQLIIDAFEEANPSINVELVLTDENVLPNLMTSNFAAGTLPDVVFHPVDFTTGWYNAGILDNAAAAAVISELGEDNFSALGLVSVDDGYAAVPTDGWGQLLVYRKDLFDAAGLEAPTTFELIETAAAALSDPDNNFYGIVAATAPGEVFTQQTFEHFALANGVSLTDADGNVTLNTEAMAEALDFYANLVSSYGPPGAQDVVTTRATYFAGQAAMIVWSPFILDEMAGLRDNAFPSCDECTDNPAFLAENSAIVPAFVGPNGMEPVQYGQVSNLGITTAATEAAQTFVQFWLTEGYADWLGVSPEGKFPMYRGADDANIAMWSTLETGVDRRAPLSDFYGEDVIATLIQGAAGFARWGFNEGQGALVGGVYQELPVPELLNEVINGSLTGAEAAEEIQFLVEDIQAGLE